MSATRPTALFVANVDWFFLSHRLPIALALRDRGFEVTVASLDTGRLHEAADHGLRIVRLPMSRQGAGPVEALRTLAALVRLYRQRRPDLIHHIAVKPIVLGSLAARAVPGTPVVNAISGFGYTGGTSLRARLLRAPLRLLYRLALRRSHSWTIFQNPEDREAFVQTGLVREEHTRLIRGSGVDTTRFAPAPEPEGAPLVLMASRMIADKGVREFVEAARLVRREHPDTRFVLVGSPDDGNPTSIPETELEAAQRHGTCEWWPHRTDMHEVIRQATVVVLPTSYKEGLPKVLIEAAACARPAVATDIPGCREIVRDGVNGLLVPERDANATAAAITKLLHSPELRAEMGERGRATVEAHFSLETIIEQTLRLYEDALEHAGRPVEADLT